MGDIRNVIIGAHDDYGDAISQGLRYWSYGAKFLDSSSLDGYGDYHESDKK